MNIIFDSNAFSNFIDNTKYNEKFELFLQKTKENKLLHIGTIEFCKELFLLYFKNKDQYFKILETYWATIKHQFLFPFNELIQMEIESKDKLSFADKIIDVEMEKNLKELMYNPKKEKILELDIIQKKVKYEKVMNQALSNLLNELKKRRHTGKDVRQGFKVWYSSISDLIQDWFESSFNIKNVPYSNLPHTKAYLDYFLCRHFEVINLSIKHKKNDYFDRSFYAVSADTGLLVSNDGNFLKTCEKINEPNVNVKNLEFFISIL